MENKEKQPLSLGSDFEAVAVAPTPAAAPAPAAPPAGGATGPMRKATSTGSMGLLIALGGLCGSYPDRYAVVQVAVAAYLVFELLQAGLARTQATYKSHGPIAGALAVVAGIVGFLPDVGGQSIVAPIFAVLGGALALAAPAISKKADAKFPPAPAEAAPDPQFSKLLLGNLLILAGATAHWTTTARGTDTILGSILIVCCVLAIFASWVGMNRTWAMPAVSSGSLGLILILTPFDGLLLGVFGLVRLFNGAGGEGMMPVGSWWPGETDMLAHGTPIFLVIAASAWSLATVVKGTMQGVEAQKKRKEEEVAARKASRASSPTEKKA
jgi:hypothetical protein